MNEDELERLRALDWEEIAAKIANFAREEARIRYGWYDTRIVSGKTPEDLACDAIAETWADPSRLPETCSITTFLCGVVKSKLWNLSQRKETQTTSYVEDLDSLEQTQPNRAPDVLAARRDDFSTAISLLAEHPSLKGKSDHELVVTALGCGFFESDDLAKETGLSISRIYQVRRELNAVYADIKKQLFIMKGADHDSK